jgi:hypothetical protein
VNNGCFDPAQAGVTCETLTMNANLLSGTLPDGRTCPQVVGASTATEQAICYQTLGEIYAAKCVTSGLLTQCLCGTTSANACIAGAVTPNGPLFDEYACDFGTTVTGVINTITTDFTIPSFGAGAANSIAFCQASFGCDCF